MCFTYGVGGEVLSLKFKVILDCKVIGFRSVHLNIPDGIRWQMKTSRNMKKDVQFTTY